MFSPPLQQEFEVVFNEPQCSDDVRVAHSRHPSHRDRGQEHRHAFISSTHVYMGRSMFSGRQADRDSKARDAKDDRHEYNPPLGFTKASNTLAALYVGGLILAEVAVGRVINSRCSGPSKCAFTSAQ